MENRGEIVTTDQTCKCAIKLRKLAYHNCLNGKILNTKTLLGKNARTLQIIIPHASLKNY